MTFKHTKFEDSELMRSLERVAFKQGLIQDESMVKFAEKNTDLTPATTLFENVIKLSAALKNVGLESFAIDLENKLLDYKKAQTLYQTSKRTGDDLIDEAHPKGSHKLENVDSKEAIFRTILDKHLSMLDVVGKNPTGKLASNKDIFNAVKMIFAQEKKYSDQLRENINENKNNALDLFKIINNIVKNNISATNPKHDIFNIQSLRMFNLFESEMTATNIDNLSKLLKKIKSVVSPGMLGGVSSEVWESSLEPLFNKIELYFNSMTSAISQITTEKGSDLASRLSLPDKVYNDAIDSNIRHLQSFKPYINTSSKLTPAQKKSELEYLEAQIQELQDLKNNGYSQVNMTKLNKLVGNDGDVMNYYKTRAFLRS